MASHRGRRSSGLKVRLIIAAVVALFAIISYYGRPGDENQITGETQRVAMTRKPTKFGWDSRLAERWRPSSAALIQIPEAQALVKKIGEELLQALDESLEPGGRSNPYRENFTFTLLDDQKTVNAFALPGGQIFITAPC